MGRSELATIGVRLRVHLLVNEDADNKLAVNGALIAAALSLLVSPMLSAQSMPSDTSLVIIQSAPSDICH